LQWTSRDRHLPAGPVGGKLAAMSLLRNRWLAIAVIVLAGLAAYASCYRGAFVLDDLTSIGGNPTLRRWADWRTVLAPLRGQGWTVEGRPLLNLSLALNYAWGGTNVTGYHAVNVALHLLAGLTLFGLLRRLTGSTGVATAAALLWTVHPLNTAAVTYVVQRAESLMGLLYLQTLYWFVRWSALGATRPTLFFAFLSVLCCWLGMATKEVMVSAPLAVLLLDRWAVAGSFGAAWRARRGYYAALFGSWLLLGALVWHTGNRGETSGFGSGTSAAHYWLSQPAVIARYLKLALWPAPLVFDSGVEWTIHPVATLGSVLLLGVLGGGTLWGLIKNRPWGGLGFVFFATLAPTSLIPGNRQTAADHRMYLALAAVLTALCLAGWVWRGRGRSSEAHLARPLSPRLQGTAALDPLATAVVLVVAAGFTAVTYRRNLDYRSPLVLYRTDVEHAPDNAYAHTNYGTALYFAKDYAAAIPQFETALQLKPDIQETEDNLGNALFALGRDNEARVHYQHVIATRPAFADAYNNLAAVELKQNRVDEARQALETAVRLSPDFAEAHDNLGLALLRQQNFSAAIAELRRSTDLTPSDPKPWMNLGNALRAAGQPAPARAALARAAELDPTNPAILTNAALPEIDLQQYDRAAAFLRHALQLDPHDAGAWENLGNVLFRTNQLAAAQESYQRAVNLDPSTALFHYNLGNGLLRLQRRTEAVPELQAALRLDPHLEPARALLKALGAPAAAP